jgi:phosphoglycolate phosphatase-like HAD superfamily hydrolase
MALIWVLRQRCGRQLTSSATTWTPPSAAPHDYTRTKPETQHNNRVVIHPKYRTIGLGAKIIRETLSLAGTPYVEMVAVMAKYNPFAEKAGLKKVAEQKPLESVIEIAEALFKLGFELPLLSSERYVLDRLNRLGPVEVEQLKGLFAKNKHPRFKKEFAANRHKPFGKNSDYLKCLESADPEKMAKLIKLVGMLLQAKIYLFWKTSTF